MFLTFPSAAPTCPARSGSWDTSAAGAAPCTLHPVGAPTGTGEQRGWRGACSPSQIHRQQEPSLHCQGSFITYHDKAIRSCSSPEPSALPFQNSHDSRPISMHPLPVNEYSPARQCCSPVITQHFTEAAHYKILWINEHPSFVSQEMYRVYTRCQVHPKTYSRYAASLLFSKAASIILIPSFLKRKIDRDISRKQIQWLKFQCTLSV